MKKILIAASGTGGHLFPAVYIAQAVRSADPEVQIAFIGSGRPLESSIFAKAGPFPVYTIPIVGLKNRGFSGMLDFMVKLPSALVQTWRLLGREKPDCIVGVGGYVTVLPVILGKFRGIPSWIHEAELSPGLANYLLSFFADKTSVAFQETKMPVQQKVVFTGHPVRAGLEACAPTGVKRSPVEHLLVLGGSQGAAALDDTLPKLSDLLKEKNLTVRHQCRSASVAEVTQRYASAGVPAEVFSFIEDMQDAYRWADVIISRAGAGSIMELSIVNKPCILVPFPFAQANHQLSNARTLGERGKALICEEGADFQQCLRTALSSITQLQQYNTMVQAPNPNRNTDAAVRIAGGIVSLFKIH